MSNQTTNTHIVTVGLDIGYGETKAVTPGAEIIFPSVMGYALELKYKQEEITAKYPGDQISDDHGDFFVGNLALAQLRAGDLLQLRSRMTNDERLGKTLRLRLAKVALGKLFASKVKRGDVLHVRIATGLPVDHMQDAAAFKQSLIGQHLIKTDQNEFVVNVVQVMVMPQPYGTIYSKMMTEQGALDPCYTAKRTGVVDVGRYTIDLTIDSDGEYIDTMSGSTENGVYTVHERISARLEAEYRRKFTLGDIDGILRTKCFRAYGKPVNYEKEVEEDLQPLREAALALMNQKWGEDNATIDVIYISGGGAALVFDAVKAVYRQAVLLESSQLANARGFLNFALFSEKE